MKNYYKCDDCEEWHNADYDEFIKVSGQFY